jgi:two-component system chemotaxis response regulator CheY
MEVPKNITFFLVEDMSFYRDLFVQSLGNLGFRGRCVLTKNYKEAIIKLQEMNKKGEKIDFIISDLELPDGTGVDICKKVRASKRLGNTPFLMVTTSDKPEVVVEAFESGIDNYLFKPIEEKSLMEKIEYCWSKRRT